MFENNPGFCGQLWGVRATTLIKVVLFSANEVNFVINIVLCAITNIVVRLLHKLSHSASYKTKNICRHSLYVKKKY